MLKDVQHTGEAYIVSFLPHGRAFRIHDVKRFTEEILPRYFKHSKWLSFSRQLSLYGFRRVILGPDNGAYYHELFLRGRKGLCLCMRRVGARKGQFDRRKVVPKTKTNKAPDFYSMNDSL
jgi:hypothetical protein